MIKRNPSITQDLQGLLSPLKGISSMGVNPVTGSLLIKYAPEAVSSEIIIGILIKAGYLDPSKAITIDQYISAKVSKTGIILWKAILGVSIKPALAGSKLSFITFLF